MVVVVTETATATVAATAEEDIVTEVGQNGYELLCATSAGNIVAGVFLPANGLLCKSYKYRTRIIYICTYSNTFNVVVL